MSKLVDRISSLDDGYVTGDLSIYPEALDSTDTLYEVANNAETKLSQSLKYNARYLVVEDTSLFPAKGLLRVGTETIYYEKKTSTTFQNIKRGYSGSRQDSWDVGTKVVNAVFAEPHNSLKDGIINIENNLGLEEDPEVSSLNGILKSLEKRYYSPKPIFRAAPIKGPSSLKVKFQNFTTGDPVRYLWDFGDGGTSVESAPTHTYLSEGIYTVKLNVISSLGGRGIVTKTNYITVDDDLKDAFFYVSPTAGTTSTVFDFVDQTEGDIASRHWIFDDGTTEAQEDPDIHATTHVYSSPGTYDPVLIVIFADQSTLRLVFDSIIVS